MSHELSKLTVVPGSKRPKRRLGRGTGSGHGKTAGRGTKGQNSRSGSGITPGFEGGQMPMHRRLPKRGFVSLFGEKYDVVNISTLSRLVGIDVVDPEVLAAAGMVSGKRRVKILADGELEKALLIKAHKFSAGAVKKIEACGGKVEEL